jgi:hypothetical protein
VSSKPVPQTNAYIVYESVNGLLEIHPAGLAGSVPIGKALIGEYAATIPRSACSAVVHISKDPIPSSGVVFSRSAQEVSPIVAIASI